MTEYEKREKKVRRLLVKSLILLLGIAIFFGLLALVCPRQTCQTKQIQAVGGCDRDGWCGVRFDDNTSSTAKFPVVGNYAKHCFEAD